jgi:carboxypeptidase family protein
MFRTSQRISGWFLLRTAGLALGLFASSALVFAQGLQTGSMSGTVKDQSGAILPAVTVSVTSPALQGTRETVTDGNGVYTLQALPPGVYTVRFALTGLAPLENANVIVPLGSVAIVDVSMSVAQVTEIVNVSAQTSNAIAAPTGQVHLTSRELNTIPVGRTPARIAEFAPGLTDNTPNVGQVTISGGFAYDNVFLIDGVDVNDNLFGRVRPVLRWCDQHDHEARRQRPLGQRSPQSVEPGVEQRVTAREVAQHHASRSAVEVPRGHAGWPGHARPRLVLLCRPSRAVQRKQHHGADSPAVHDRNE